MALDIQTLRSKLQQFNRQAGSDTSIWKPNEGKTVIRIVPWKENPSNPFIELYFHYLGNKTYLSPISFGKRDPIAEFADELASSGKKEDWIQSRPFRPKLRTFVPIIVRGQEKEGVRFFSFVKTVYTELLSIINDPDYGDITDIKSGRDIVVEYIPQSKSDTSFSKTLVRPKPNQTPLSSDTEEVKKWLSVQPEIRGLFKEYSYQELKEVLERYLDPDSHITARKSLNVVEDDSAETTTTRPVPNKKVSDIVDEFDEVFN